MNNKADFYILQVTIDGEIVQGIDAELKATRYLFTKYVYTEVESMNPELKKAINKLHSIKMITFDIFSGYDGQSHRDHIKSYRYVHYSNDVLHGSHYNGSYNFDNSLEYTLKDVTERVKEFQSMLFRLYIEQLTGVNE